MMQASFFFDFNNGSYYYDPQYVSANFSQRFTYVNSSGIVTKKIKIPLTTKECFLLNEHGEPDVGSALARARCVQSLNILFECHSH